MSLGLRRLPWYEGLGPVTAEVGCSGARHRVTWRNGKLILEDHDVLAEEALAALGADPPICLEVLRVWRKVQGEPWRLHALLGSQAGPVRERDLDKERAQLRTQLAHLQSSWASAQSRQQGAAARNPTTPQLAQAFRTEERFELEWNTRLIYALPHRLRRMLGLASIVACERRWRDEGFREQHAGVLQSLLTTLAPQLFEESVRRWVCLRPYGSVVFDCWLIEPGGEARMSAWADGEGAYGAASLPLSWLTQVWGKGIGLVDGCFVLAVRGGSWRANTLHVHAGRWEPESPGTRACAVSEAILSRTGEDGWRLWWL